MKCKFILPILLGFYMTGMSASKADNPGGIPCNEESAAAELIPGLNTPFYIDPVSKLPVNELEVKAGLLYDAVNGKIVWQKNICNAYPIASLTKMMVALLAVEDVRAGLYNWTDNV